VLLGAFFLFIASVQVSLVFLLAIDILLPVLVSLIVLLLQPFVVVARNRTIAIATAKRKKHENLIVIGITGSYGKTSTKEFLSHILSAKFRVLKTKEHQNSETAIAKTIVQDLTKEHQVFVCEMGAYGKGGVQLLASMAQPTIGVVTGVNEQHLSLFGTMANLQRAEGGEELLESLPRDGAVVLNYNSKHLKHADLPGKYSELLYVRICSTQEKKDVWAESIQVGKEHVSFVLHFKDGDTSPVVMKLLGKHNVENALLAAAVAKDLGMKAKEIAQQLRTVVPSVGVMKLKKGKQGLQIIDSSYSANPNGVIASLEYLSLWPGKKILVLPSLIELGQASREAHKRIGKEIAHICDLVFVTTADHIQDLQEGAGEKSSIIQLQENPQEVVKAIHAFAKPGDVVLLEGRVPAQLLELL
jgi:UDP-N-acetylmuramoyl-tripeptide--D-alanyl-D-alanine ligase